MQKLSNAEANLRKKALVVKKSVHYVGIYNENVFKLLFVPS